MTRITQIRPVFDRTSGRYIVEATVNGVCLYMPAEDAYHTGDLFKEAAEFASEKNLTQVAFAR